MSLLIAATLIIAGHTSAAASAVNEEWLIKTSQKKHIEKLSSCETMVLNPHLGGDILKVKCSNTWALNSLSPLADIQFETESTWTPLTTLKTQPAMLNDPLINDQWALDQINIWPFWDEQTQGQTHAKVAIIDTGVDFEHEDLRGQILINDGEIPNNQQDDDQNGYVDDVYGWNSFDNNGNVKDIFDHGTHVAGIIGAKPGNSVGIAGMNWNISLIPVRFIGANGGGSTEGAIRAFDYAVARGAQIINASWGGPRSSPLLQETIARCREKGILLVAAAGNESVDNDTTPTYPANFDLDNIISVAATDLHGNIADFSNWGKKTVHIAAPGQSILSTISGNKYGYNNGTSMATPHIAGAAALIWAQNPSWSYQEVRRALLQSCSSTPELAGKVQCGGFFSF